jgi:hypothetical protein
MAKAHIASSTLACMALNIQGDINVGDITIDHTLWRYSTLIIDYDNLILITEQALSYDAIDATIE